MRKSYNYEVITFFSNGVKKYLGSRSGFKASRSGYGMRFWLDPDSIEYGSETLFF